MAKIVLIYGPSGSGKSSSLQNFAHDEVAVVNVNNKPFPFKTKFDGSFSSTEYLYIASQMKRTQKNAIVIDDAGYLITSYFMENQGKNKGNNAFAMYSEMAEQFYNLIRTAAMDISDDKIVYFIMHEDKSEFGNSKPKTIGKMLDEKVCIEGLFSIVLRSEFKDGRYVFHTKTDGLDVAKSPMGMFEKDDIDNDLKIVDTAIREYYEMPALRSNIKEPKEEK